MVLGCCFLSHGGHSRDERRIFSFHLPRARSLTVSTGCDSLSNSKSTENSLFLGTAAHPQHLRSLSSHSRRLRRFSGILSYEFSRWMDSSGYPSIVIQLDQLYSDHQVSKSIRTTRTQYNTIQCRWLVSRTREGNNLEFRETKRKQTVS